MTRRAKSRAVETASIQVGGLWFVIGIGTMLEFKKSGLQGMMRGTVIALFMRADGGVSIRMLMSYWDDGAGWRRFGGSPAVWIRPESVLKVL